jgi:two-component system response regulator AtoC
MGKMDDWFDGYSLKAAQKILEKKLITKALKTTNGNRTHAAKILEISHPSLLSKIKAYDINL